MPFRTMEPELEACLIGRILLTVSAMSKTVGCGSRVK
ncbi:MAG: hypothetical protein GPOALKHO_000513 [Sodalis sp.]|nr:MAG: hypothetical protein GPOALKHO_000513 [Sodalis sp.]